MTARILDGKWLAREIQELIRGEVAQFSGRPPGLGVILVGDNPASQTYVASKTKVAQGCGLATFDQHLSANATAEEVRQAIDTFNNDDRVDGILLQLPLPKSLKADEFLDRIRADKDADGLHPLNQGRLARGDTGVRPCTPLGCMLLMDVAFSKLQSGDKLSSLADLPRADLSGKHAVVIGRSVLVGKPVAQLLLERNATVTVAHSRTHDLPAVARSADVLVAAVGIPGLVKGEWVKEGAIVLDVGINRLPTGKLTGDVDYAPAAERASAITPVPGGVGPLTVTMLIHNTVQAYKGKHQ